MRAKYFVVESFGIARSQVQLLLKSSFSTFFARLGCKRIVLPDHFQGILDIILTLSDARTYDIF